MSDMRKIVDNGRTRRNPVTIRFSACPYSVITTRPLPFIAITLLLVSYDLSPARTTFVPYQKKQSCAVTAITADKEVSVPSVFECYCAARNWRAQYKNRQRQRHNQAICTLQKNFCQRFFDLIKIRLGVKECNLDNPCNE